MSSVRKALDELRETMFANTANKPVVHINSVRKVAPPKASEAPKENPPVQTERTLEQRYNDAGHVARRYSPQEED